MLFRAFLTMQPKAAPIAGKAKSKKNKGKMSAKADEDTEAAAVCNNHNNNNNNHNIQHNIFSIKYNFPPEFFRI